MGKENIEIMRIERIPLKERNNFQSFLVKSIFGEKPINETEEEWDKKILAWFDMYAKEVSDIIDNIKNKNIRDLIMKGEYEKASNIIIEMLEEKRLKIAA